MGQHHSNSNSDTDPYGRLSSEEAQRYLQSFGFPTLNPTNSTTHRHQKVVHSIPVRQVISRFPMVLQPYIARILPAFRDAHSHGNRAEKKGHLLHLRKSHTKSGELTAKDIIAIGNNTSCPNRTLLNFSCLTYVVTR